jgi:hypothetical protein
VGEKLGVGVCRSGGGSNVLQAAKAKLNHVELRTKRAFMSDFYYWVGPARERLLTAPTHQPPPLRERVLLHRLHLPETGASSTGRGVTLITEK